MPRPSHAGHLLDAAIRLFALHGVDGTSIRAVTRAARLNPAAVHYHFGSHDQLVRAVLERLLPPLLTRQLLALDRLVERAGSAPLPVEALLDAVLSPEFALRHAPLERDRHAGAALGRIRLSAGAGAAAAARLEAPLSARLQELLAQALPGVSPELLGRRLDWMRRLVAAELALGPSGGPAAERGRELVAVLAPALRARPAAALPDSAAPVVRLT